MSETETPKIWNDVVSWEVVWWNIIAFWWTAFLVYVLLKNQKNFVWVLSLLVLLASVVSYTTMQVGWRKEATLDEELQMLFCSLILLTVTYMHGLSKRRFGPYIFRLLILFQIGVLYESMSKQADEEFYRMPYEGDILKVEVKYRMNPPDKTREGFKYDQYINCRGTGEFVIVLAAGQPFSSASMVGPARLISKQYSNVTVCTYDRMGYGWSQKAINPRTLVNMASEIRSLIHKKLNTRAPQVIFVGWSYGGLIGQTYANIWPGDISALVLVDSMNCHVFKDHPQFVKEIEYGVRMLTLMKALTPIGVGRLLASFGLFPAESGYPPNDALLSPKSRQTMSSFYFHQDRFLDVAVQELEAMQQTVNNIHENWCFKQNCLRETPIVVLQAEKGVDPKTSARDLDRLLSLSTGVIPMSTNKSDHFIPFYDPASIVDAVRVAMIHRRTYDPRVSKGPN